MATPPDAGDSSGSGGITGLLGGLLEDFPIV